MEKKLTSKLQANIKQIIEQSLKNLWEEWLRSECKSFIDSEVNSAKQELTKIRQDVQTLAGKTDHILGSIAYISNEYDEIFDKASKSNKLGQKIKKELEQIGRRQNFIEEQIDHLEQYGRRENLEIGLTWCSPYEERKH